MKRNLMTVLTCVCAVLSIHLCSVSFAEDSGTSHPRTDKQNNSANESGQVLTDELKAKVAAILSNYDVDTLTVADAKEINSAFREAGIRRGSAQQEAIKAAGFDPKKISCLDPPPDQKSKPNTKSIPE
jgi:hypothetical protein